MRLNISVGVYCTAKMSGHSDLIGETLVQIGSKTTASTPAATAAGKVLAVLRGLETYVAGQSDLIIDYATARHGDEPKSTAPTEGTIEWLLRRRRGEPANALVAKRGASHAESVNCGDEAGVVCPMAWCRSCG